MKKVICPLLKKECIEDECKWWTHVYGTNPQTGNPVDHHDCAIPWIPILLVETAKEVRQGAAATESFRNETVKRHDQLNNLLASAADFELQKRIEEANRNGSSQHFLPPSR